MDQKLDQITRDEIYIPDSASDEIVAANKKALEYLHSIDFKSFAKAVFKEDLATVSDTGKNIGELKVSVEEIICNEEMCFYVHAQSHGELDNVPMGTSVTAYISRGVVTLEQTQHEYIKFPNNPLDKKTVIVKSDDKYHIKRITTQGDKINESEKSIPLPQMKGFISEGANIIVQRIMCLRQDVPEKATFVSLDSALNLSLMTYEKLPDKTFNIENTTQRTIGIQREQLPKGDSTMSWQTYFLHSGHIANRTTIGSTVRMQLLSLPKPEEEEVQTGITTSDDEKHQNKSNILRFCIKHTCFSDILRKKKRKRLQDTS